MCIGRALDHEAASAQLEACLLTTEEMAAGERRWLSLPDPYADPSVERRVGRDLRLFDTAFVAVLVVFAAAVYAFATRLVAASPVAAVAVADELW